MSENLYRGLSTLVNHGFEIVVHADLAVRRSPDGGQEWGGHLQADRDEDFELMADVSGGRLRMPDGREADFAVGAGGVVTGGMEIAGSGPAPF